MIGINSHFSSRFYAGVFLVVFSLILGKSAILIFWYPWLSPLFLVSIYILSWPLLIIGLWIVGKEYHEQVKKYISYNFYRESIKNKTKQVYRSTKERTHHVRERVKARMPFKFKPKG